MTRTNKFKLILIVWLAAAGYFAWQGLRAEQFDQLRLPISAINNPKDPFWAPKPMPPEEIQATIELPPTIVGK